MALPDDLDAHPVPTTDLQSSLSRRGFLQVSAAMAGSALLSSCFSDSENETAQAPGAEEVYLPTIKNFVVVMFENRSFDSLLAYLYSDGTPQPNWPTAMPVPPTPGSGQSFDGLWKYLGGIGTCTGTSGCNLNSALPSQPPVWAHPHNFDPSSTSTTDWTHPNPNAHEGYKAYYDTQFANGMGGFVAEYTPNCGDPTQIMGSYTATQLPILSGLARGFAVFDNWFCAVPSETYCNRSFFHAATSSGYLYNSPTSEDEKNKITSETAKWANNTTPTIFERSGTKFSWAVYYEPGSVADGLDHGLTALIHPNAYSSNKGNFVSVDFTNPANQFFTDIANGNLRQYSFIEPIYTAADAQGKHYQGHDFHPPQDVRFGEEVIRQIYEAIRQSAAPGTKHDYTQDTMLLIVFDEHGGTYDHVQPPTGVPAPPVVPSPYIPNVPNFDEPDPANPSKPIYNFNTLGARVPAIAISAYTTPGTVVNARMHHSAVIRTLVAKFDVEPLSTPNPRETDPNGGHLGLAVNNTATPLPGSMWPAFPNPRVSLTALPGSTVCTS